MPDNELIIDAQPNDEDLFADGSVLEAEIAEGVVGSELAVMSEDAEDTAAAEFIRVRSELAALETESTKMTTGVGQPGTDIVPLRSADPVAVKQQMAAIRSQALKTSIAIREKRKELEHLMKAEMERARQMLGPMEALIGQLEENITTVNLYLGNDEEIMLLRDGESAPADEPITMRQLLLYMDEECGAAAEKGGIQTVDVETFDEWLLAHPAHLDQVLPETKGIVALRPRRKPHREAEGKDSESNKRTYWLVRNGERVYRTLTKLEVADNRVLPLTDEFERLFTRHKSGRAIPLRPGSREWEEAQGAAEETERKYMRVGLLLEGLLHRTPIFHPLPQSGVSFIDPMCVRRGLVRYITDAEASLGTGAESFDAWRLRLCGELRPGMRIILGPGIHREQYERSSKNPRLHPQIANEPQVQTVYVIDERKKGGGLVFRYHEGPRYVGDGAWGGGEYREPKHRASCTVFPKDEYVLPFDLASPEDMQRFLHSRTDRQHYVQMFPVLKAAIAAKARETEVEEPFRVMLAGVLARENKVSVAEAVEAIPGLVDWWKLRNKYHRPLLPQAARPHVEIPKEEELLTAGGRRRRSSAAEEERKAAEAARARAAAEEVVAAEQGAKAVRMIVAEHRRRLEDARRGAKSEIVERLQSLHPNALLIARLRRAGYLVLDPAEAVKNVFVHESEYSAAGVLKNVREWALPGVTRPKQWLILFAAERWENWDLVADEREHLRGPEAELLVETVIAAAAANEDALALAWNGKVFTLWTRKDDAVLDETHLLSASQRPPKIGYRERGWERVRGTVRLRGWNYEREESYGGSYDKTLPWEKLQWLGSLSDEEREAPRKPQHNVIWRGGTAIAHLEAEKEHYDKVDGREEKLRLIVSGLTKAVENEWLARAWATERARFDEDFGDPELWAAHAKTKERTIRFPHTLQHYSGSYGAPTALWDAIAVLTEAGENVEGQTVGEVLAAATSRFGTEQAQLHGSQHHDKRAQYVYQAAEELHDYVLQAPAPEAAPKHQEDDEFDDS